MYLDCVFRKEDDSVRFNAFPPEVKKFLKTLKEEAKDRYYVVRGVNLIVYTVDEYLNLEGHQ